MATATQNTTQAPHTTQASQVNKQLVARIMFDRSQRNNARYTYFAVILRCGKTLIYYTVEDLLELYSGVSINGIYYLNDKADAVIGDFVAEVYYHDYDTACEAIGEVEIVRERGFAPSVKVKLLDGYSYKFEASRWNGYNFDYVKYYYLRIYRDNELVARIKLIPVKYYADKAFDYCPAYTP